MTLVLVASRSKKKVGGGGAKKIGEERASIRVFLGWQRITPYKPIYRQMLFRRVVPREKKANSKLYLANRGEKAKVKLSSCQGELAGCQPGVYTREASGGLVAEPSRKAGDAS